MPALGASPAGPTCRRARSSASSAIRPIRSSRRWGIYSFGPGADPEPTRDTYLERLAAAGVKPASGDCKAGTPGDRSWPANLEDVGEDGGLSSLRSGCFLDENGIANVRLTCYGEFYVGVLGQTKELRRALRLVLEARAGRRRPSRSPRPLRNRD